MGTSRPGGAAPPSLKSLTTEGLLVPEGGEDRGSGGPKTGPPASPLDRSTQPRLGTLRGGPGPGAAVPARKKLLPFSPGWPEPDLVSGTPSRSHRQVSPGVEVRLQAWWPVYLGRQSSAPRHLPGSAALSRVLGPALSLVWTGGCKSGSKPHPTPAAHHAPAPSTPPPSPISCPALTPSSSPALGGLGCLWAWSRTHPSSLSLEPRGSPSSSFLACCRVFSTSLASRLTWKQIERDGKLCFCRGSRAGLISHVILSAGSPGMVKQLF